MQGLSGRKHALTLVGLALLCSTLGPFVRAEDVTTLSGKTLRQVKLARLDPDGVTWEHATGICKVDFTDLPAAIRQRYHYDPVQAAAYKTAQARALQRVAEQLQQDQRNLAAWRKAHYSQRQAAASGADADPLTFVYHRDLTIPRAVGEIDEQATTQKAAFEKLHEYDGTLYDRRIWAIPQMIIGIHSDGHDFDPPDKESPEYKRGLRRSPGDKGWYEGVDRAEAFARGQP